MTFNKKQTITENVLFNYKLIFYRDLGVCMWEKDQERGGKGLSNGQNEFQMDKIQFVKLGKRYTGNHFQQGIIFGTIFTIFLFVVSLKNIEIRRYKIMQTIS